VSAEPAIAVIHADADCIVVCKPGGLLSVPGRGEAGRDCAKTGVDSASNRIRERVTGMVTSP
jgi:23S rRNA-/tRNA-specific pseudouridylate synthase